MPRMAGSARVESARRSAWVWFIVGGAFILVPGVTLFYFLGFPALAYVAELGGPGTVLWIPFLLVTLGPTIVLLVVGLCTIAFGVRRRFAAHS